MDTLKRRSSELDETCRRWKREKTRGTGSTKTEGTGSAKMGSIFRKRNDNYHKSVRGFETALSALQQSMETNRPVSPAVSLELVRRFDNTPLSGDC